MTQKTPQFWDKGIQLVGGCTKVSPGCKNCWSERMHARYSQAKKPAPCYKDTITDGRFNGNVTFNLHLLEKAAAVKTPQVIAIWNDLYHEGVTLEQMTDAHCIMDSAKHHIFLIITKRIENAADYCEGVSALSGGISLPDHIWHIVTCENQAMADKRIPHLLRIPGKRGIIIEPMLEGMDLSQALIHCPWADAMEKEYNGIYCANYCVSSEWECNGPESLIHQVICGPENGPGKRTFDPAWAESVKAQCEAAGVPYYRKDKAEGVLAWR